MRCPVCTQPTTRIWPSRAWQKLSSPKVLLANPERGPRILARAGVEPQPLHDIDTIEAITPRHQWRCIVAALVLDQRSTNNRPSCVPCPPVATKFCSAVPLAKPQKIKPRNIMKQHQGSFLLSSLGILLRSPSKAIRSRYPQRRGCVPSAFRTVDFGDTAPAGFLAPCVSLSICTTDRSWRILDHPGFGLLALTSRQERRRG